LTSAQFDHSALLSDYTKASAKRLPTPFVDPLRRGNACRMCNLQWPRQHREGTNDGRERWTEKRYRRGDAFVPDKGLPEACSKVLRPSGHGCVCRTVNQRRVARRVRMGLTQRLLSVWGSNRRLDGPGRPRGEAGQTTQSDATHQLNLRSRTNSTTTERGESECR
jgi:hypothetical protein